MGKMNLCEALHSVRFLSRLRYALALVNKTVSNDDDATDKNEYASVGKICGV
jgi:hypothetical protein